MATSLKSKAISGIGWSAADSILGQGVTFIVGIVLARLLSPAEYGLIGIVLIFTTVLSGIVDSGFSNALIRQKETSENDYNTMFITNLVISVLLFLLLYACAPLIADFFERTELTAITRVTGVILIIQALSIIHVTILTKRIDFKTKTKASLISAIISGIIGITMAILGFGVWALVGQQISKQFFFTVSLWILNHWLPNGTFCWKSFKYMWGFGWKLMLSGILNNVWNQLYQVVVGKFYTPATLGQYTRSSEYASIFSSNLTSIIQRVTYPVFAETQDDTTRMVAGYRKIVKLTMFVTAMCMISLGAISEPLIYSLIGPKWHQAALFLPLICVLMSLYPLQAINLNMLQVLGRSDIFLLLEILKKIIGIGPLCLGIFVGIYWMLAGSIVAGIISFFLNSYYTGKKLGYTSWQQIKDVAPSYGIALIIAVSVYFFKFLPINSVVILIVQLIVGALVFFFVCEAFKFEEYVEIKGIAVDYISKERRRNGR